MDSEFPTPNPVPLPEPAPESEVKEEQTHPQVHTEPNPPNPPSQIPNRPKDVQGTLNEMVWKHGIFLDKRADYDQLLKAWGLEKSQVDKTKLKFAVQEAKRRAKMMSEKKGEENSILSWMPDPDTDILPSGLKVFYWETKCGRYRVYRIGDLSIAEYLAQYRTPEATMEIFEHSSEGPGYPSYMKSLELALVAVEKFHEKETNVPVLVQNRQEVLEVELKMFPKVAPAPATQPTPSATPVASGASAPTTPRASKSGDLDAKILSVLNLDTPMSPKQIKQAAGIPLHTGINSIMKRLGKENKVVVGYGAYKLHPSMAQQNTAPAPTPAPAPEETQEVKDETPSEPEQEKKEE